MGKSVRTAIVAGRRLPVGVKLLRVVEVCGVEVAIVRATPDDVPELHAEDGEVNDGFYCPQRTTIFIRAGQSRTQERDSVVHEIGHAFLQLSGLTHILKAELRDPSRYEDLEETLVRVATPNLVSLKTGNKRGR